MISCKSFQAGVLVGRGAQQVRGVERRQQRRAAIFEELPAQPAEVPLRASRAWVACLPREQITSGRINRDLGAQIGEAGRDLVPARVPVPRGPRI